MARTLSIMSLLEGGLMARAHLHDDGTVTLEGNEGILEDMRVVAGPKGQLRPKDGLPYFEALKAMYDRATFVASYEAPEELDVWRKVKRVRASERRGKSPPPTSRRRHPHQ